MQNLAQYALSAILIAALWGGQKAWHQNQRSGGLDYSRSASAPMALGARTGNGFQVKSGETITVNYRVTARQGKALICLNRRPRERRNGETIGTIQSVTHVNAQSDGTLSAVASQDGIYEVTIGAPLSDFQGEVQASWQVGQGKNF